MASFQDHFSSTAAAYARFRPRYPAELYAWVAAHSPGRERAWDCATGSGQAALGLADLFERVVATDASRQQLDHAFPHPRVDYRCAPAEASGLEVGSVDAVTVATALHWFDFERFVDEVRRVARPGALLAVWSYAGAATEPAVAAVMERLADEVLGPYWDPAIGAMRKGYTGLAFPFEEIEAPAFTARHDWGVDEILGYTGTWSASRRYREERGEEPTEVVRAELVEAMAGRERVELRWPLVFRAFRVD